MISAVKHPLKKNRKRVKSPSVPTEDDWGEYKSDLDQNHAHSVFAGCTNEEMQPFFRRNPLAMTDDLRWMPDVPFRYYILGFRDFMTAKQFDFLEGSDAASCFLGLVLEKLENHPRLVVPVMPELLPAVEYVARNQSLFDADESIYGNLSEKLSRIKTLYAPYAALNC
jgi:hypothetical protein